MPATQRQREASEGRSLLSRRLARCVVLAGGTIAAWLLASGIASATDAMTVQDPPAPGSSLPSTGSTASTAGGSLVGGLAESGGVPAGQVHQTYGALPAIVAPQPAPMEPAHLPGSAAAHAGQALGPATAPAALPVPAALPIGFGVPGGLAFPRLPEFPGLRGLPELSGVGAPVVTGPRPGQVNPIILPSGDGDRPHSGGALAALPAVAADATTVPAAPTPSAPTDLATVGTPSAATPEPAGAGQIGHAGQTGPGRDAPAGGLPCAPPPALPASAPGAASAATTAVDSAFAATPVQGTPARAPRHAPTSTTSIADQPGSTPD